MPSSSARLLRLEALEVRVGCGADALLEVVRVVHSRAGEVSGQLGLLDRLQLAVGAWVRPGPQTSRVGLLLRLQGALPRLVDSRLALVPGHGNAVVPVAPDIF